MGTSPQGSRGAQLHSTKPELLRAGTEEAALAALDRGDRKGALSILMRDYGQQLYAFCESALRDPALAEDVHQHCFVQAYEDLPRFSRRSSLKTWLFGIANHRCLDAAKGRRRFLARFTQAAPALPEPADEAAPVDERLEKLEVEQALARCVEQLAPASRTAVNLRYVQGFSYEEMSAICGEKPGTLQARVTRALPVVMKCLAASGVSP